MSPTSQFWAEPYDLRDLGDFPMNAALATCCVIALGPPRSPLFTVVMCHLRAMDRTTGRRGCRIATLTQSDLTAVARSARGRTPAVGPQVWIGVRWGFNSEGGLQPLTPHPTKSDWLDIAAA